MSHPAVATAATIKRRRTPSLTSVRDDMIPKFVGFDAGTAGEDWLVNPQILFYTTK
jgi:hypothetical protein